MTIILAKKISYKCKILANEIFTYSFMLSYLSYILLNIKSKIDYKIEKPDISYSTEWYQLIEISNNAFLIKNIY